MQVNFLPATVEVEPTFAHAVPAFTAPNAGSDRKLPTNTIETTKAKFFFMPKMVLSPIGFVSQIPTSRHSIQGPPLLVAP